VALTSFGRSDLVKRLVRALFDLGVQVLGQY
jgi:hypothetical protein